LADVGIRLVVIEHLPGTRIDGAALWLNGKTPAIALSLRYDRIDAFWFTLCHELSHIKHNDGRGACTIDDGLVGNDADSTDEKPALEQRADREAAHFLVPEAEIEGFIACVGPLFSKQRIVQFANRLGVHPGIIVGQLQRRKQIQYSHSREMLTKVRESITQATLSDGWGTSPPID
jgi:HTH-type transcriptional regulator / antitoxin HigA